PRRSCTCCTTWASTPALTWAPSLTPRAWPRRSSGVSCRPACCGRGPGCPFDGPLSVSWLFPGLWRVHRSVDSLLSTVRVACGAFRPHRAYERGGHDGDSGVEHRAQPALDVDVVPASRPVAVHPAGRSWPGRRRL